LTYHKASRAPYGILGNAERALADLREGAPGGRRL